MSCSSTDAVFPRAFAFPYSGSQFMYDSINYADGISAYVATGTVRWDYSASTPWPGQTKQYDDYTTDYSNDVGKNVGGTN